MKDILVVDDDQFIRKFLKRSLVKSGYNVETIASPEEFFQKFTGIKKFPFQLVILDYQMPGMTGEDFYNYFQENYLDPCQFIILTAYPDKPGVERLLGDNLTIVNKPCDLEILLYVIAKLFKEDSK